MKFTLIFILVILLFVSCEEKITDPPPGSTVSYHSVSGTISYKDKPILGVKVSVDGTSVFTDSLGFFKFDSVKSGSIRLLISEKRFSSVDTLLNVNDDVSLSITLYLRDNSFFPNKIGNWWILEDWSGALLKIEITDSVFIDEELYLEYEYTRNQSSVPSVTFLRRVSNDTLYEYNCSQVQILALIDSVNREFVYESCVTWNKGAYDSKFYETQYDSVSFYYRHKNALDADFGLTFQKGIGIVRFLVNGWYDYHLVDYKIK